MWQIRSAYTVTIKQTETVHTCKTFKIRELVPSTSRGEMTVRENALLWLAMLVDAQPREKIAEGYRSSMHGRDWVTGLKIHAGSHGASQK